MIRLIPLHGGPYERGRLQAACRPDLVGSVRAAVELRLAQTQPALARPDVRRWIERQRAFTAGFYPQILQEMAGIADGFGLGADALFDYLHCGIAAELAEAPEAVPEGCTAFAATAPGGGAVVAKNRDYRREHIGIQQLFRHSDPGWNGRSFLCVGSLGSPGNFSSGINSDGLAVADTNIPTTDHGVGMHRYFLLTWLLERCSDVAGALAAIRAMPHAGGGVIVMGDAAGAVAAVELGHRGIGIEHWAQGIVGRTNHFISDAMATANRSGAGEANSRARLRGLRGTLVGAAPPDEAAALDLLSFHGEPAALCRHGGFDGGETISAHAYHTPSRRLLFAPGNPCDAGRHAFDLLTDHPGETS